MKLNKNVLLFSALGLLILGSCGTGGTTSSGDATIDTSSIVGYKYGRDIFDNYMAQNYEFGYSLGVDWDKGYMPSRGKSKMLAVPVLFSDTTKTDAQKQEMQDTIQKAFFGESDDTGWESVKSYYYKSSFHQLDIQGTVTDCVTLPRTFKSYSGMASEGAATNSIVNTVYKTLFETSTSALYGKASDYDSNGDGVIDSIYMVNEAEIDSNLGWAFTTWYYASVKSYPIGSYAWSSINFTTRRPGYTADKPDAHTYIHETGHILGLNDYYDSYNSYNCIAGGGTMQDFNICDHDPYSKFLWGWTSPKAVTDKNTESSITIELSPSETSGDCLILASEYNDTSLDEYIIMDYYTPTGLNEADAKTKYESALGIDGSGIRIWHVDKRVYDAYLSISGDTITTYYDPNESETPDMTAGDIHPDTADVKDFYTEFSTNSSKNYSVSNFTTKPELELLRAHEDSKSAAATADALFVAGDTFGASGDKFSDFEFYSTSEELDYDCTVEDYTKSVKNKLPYSVKVDSIGDKAVLTLTKLA